MKKIIILYAFLFIFSCCSDDDSTIENEVTSINLVTGLDIRADDFSTPLRLGNPNILVEQTIVFPIPSSIALTIHSLSSAEISDIWIIKGDVQQSYQNSDFDAILNNNLYSEVQLNNNSEETFTNINSSNITINLSDFEEGYYRAFIKIDGSIEWHNIYVGSPDINAFIESWN